MNAPSVLQVRVAACRDEAEGIRSFELVAVDGRPLPSFSAGSHVDVQVPQPDGATLTRPYSLCNPPVGEASACDRYQIAVLREPASRGGSAAMHDAVREGTVLAISAPKNHFALAHDAPHHLLMAGGIGITPILCMAERLATIGASFALHYATRCRARTAFLERIAGSAFAAKARFHFDDGDASQRLDIAGTIAAAPAGAHLYVCGPKGFMDAVLAAARAAGWSEGRLHLEFFSAEVAVRDADAPFEVLISSSGRTITVPREKTVVQALADAGIVVPTSCEQGVCGTCLTRVLDGTPDHRDVYLTPEEQAAGDQFTPCCSRARSARLVLDL